jgi:ATP-dependent DNA ligase
MVSTSFFLAGHRPSDGFTLSKDPYLKEPVRYSSELEADLPDLIETVKKHGLEGLVAKRRDSRYEPGLRSGAWRKMGINKGRV